jgi:hypothetical protein
MIDLIVAVRQHRLAVQGSAIGAAQVGRVQVVAAALDQTVMARNAVFESAEVGQVEQRLKIRAYPASQD